MRLPKKSLIALVGAGLAGSANGQAITLSQFTGNDGTDQIFGADITNTSGVNFDSGSLDYSKLFQDTANLDWNIEKYDGQNGGNLDGHVTLSEFLPKAKTDGDVYFNLDNLGDVYSGWSGNIGNDGIVDITNNGGIPDVTYDVWNTTETMETFLGIDNSLFTDPATSTIVPITLSITETITDFATGTSGISVITADGFAYEVVPEPSLTAAVLGLLSLGLAAVRRRA